MRIKRWVKRTVVVFSAVVGLSVGVAGLDACSSVGAQARGARLDRVLSSPQYSPDEGRFVNRLPRKADPSGSDFAKHALFGPEAVRQPTEPVPFVERAERALAARAPAGVQATWLGHSTMLIDVDGHRVLTDPMFSERASPFSFVGPARFHPPPIALEDLPTIDAIVISHDHYDHLDADTIRWFAQNTEVPVHAPLGVGAHLEAFGLPSARVVEHDWWDSARVGDIELIATPARHFSGRWLDDRDATLWASWVVKGPEHRAFFSGDTALHPEFEEIGERYGPFDITMMETGAYNQLWADSHMGPEQAVMAHRMVRGKVMIPVHWGTFELSMHAWTEPGERVLVAAQRAGVDVRLPRPGQTVSPQDSPLVARWWPDVPWQTAEQAPVVSTGLDDVYERLLPSALTAYSRTPK
jgi:L-ascorbate metabolism protein UlaG (beta-lactamase superfamily)